MIFKTEIRGQLFKLAFSDRQAKNTNSDYLPLLSHIVLCLKYEPFQETLP